MKVLLSFLLAIIAFFFCLNISAQDVIYTISGEIYHQKTPLDSISVENLTKQTSFGFGELPERDDYRINLTQNKYWGSTSVYDLAYDNNIYMLENKPGLISVGYSGQTATNASITLYNVNGQKLLAKNNLTLDNGSLVEVEINHAGVYLLHINTPLETKTFKAIGASKSGQLAIALQNNSAIPLKNGQLYHVDGHTQTGDNIKIRVFKSNYVAAPIEITVEKDTSLVFALDSVTAPTVQTLDVSNILSNSATLNGTILNDGHSPITECGFYWSATNENPGEADSIIVVEVTTGSFSTELSGLELNTSYYMRAFAINEIGISYGEQISFTTLDSISLCDALDNCNLTFTHSGNAEWYVQTAKNYYGGSSAQSGSISHDQQSTLETTVTGPGLLSFYWKVSSRLSWDKLIFYIGTTLEDNISGNVDWQLKEYEIPEGAHTLKWSYTKNWMHNNGQDCGWLDKVVFTPVEPTLPSVTTANITNISQTTASLGCEVTSSGFATITTRGVCWNTTGNPTIADSITIDGTGTGTFTSSITGLTANTTYYVRTYATNSLGTIYGQTSKFTTLAISSPTVITTSITKITPTTAISGGKAISDGGATVTSQGVCWNTTGSPTINDSKTIDNLNIFAFFTSTITGLTANTIYYVRAYATNSKGTGYGEQISFTTELWQRDINTTIKDVYNPLTGKTWMDRNLGARSVARSTTDEYAYGYLYQWGRAAYEQKKGSSQALAIRSNSNSPEHERFIHINGNYEYDWHTPQDTNLWQGINGINNPCPRGYRLPTEAELDEELKSWSKKNAAGAFRSPLKLPMPGYRDHKGYIHFADSNGKYWSSTINGTSARNLYFNNYYASISESDIREGYSIRCIKHYETQTLPSISSENITNTTQTTANSGGEVTSTGLAGITARGVCWNTTGNPTIDDNKTVDGTDFGTFTSSITGLTANTTYYVRAYATNSHGTAYGEQLSFTTKAPIPICDALDYCDFSFTYSGNSDWFGQTSVNYYRGSSAQSGSISDDQQSILETTISGPGVLSFYWKVSCKRGYDKLNFYIGTSLKDNISGDVDWQLKEFDIPEGTHTLKWSYKKTYWENNGQDCGWIDKITFSSKEISLPTVTTTEVSPIKSTSAITGGEIAVSGFANITARGVCWNTTGNPTIGNSKTSNGTGFGNFTSTITGLSVNTTYYVRAYATNSKGTAYGEQLIFKTRDIGEEWWQRDTQTDLVDITNPITGKTWMDRNLGANRAANNASDTEAFGDLYQWGRSADGHQKRYSQETSILSRTDVPGHRNFILCNNQTNYDWRNPRNDNLWQGTNGNNNPCPKNYRLPTISEWEEKRQSWNSNNIAGAFNSPLKINLAGERNGLGGGLFNVRSDGYYWSSTLADDFSKYLHIGSKSAGIGYNNRANGYSVRCIKDSDEQETSTLYEALNNYILTFNSSGDADWTSQTTVSYYGSTAAQSGSISNSQQSTLETTVTGPGILSFYWKVSSENDSDKLIFYLDTNPRDNISGIIDWQLREYEIPEGNHTLKWSYTKDSSGSNEDDCSWLDKIEYKNGEATLPTVITVNTTNITSTTAVSCGEVISTGLAKFSESGFCWNTTDNPTINDNKTNDGIRIGTFKSELYNLKPQTTYYIRAYSTNSQGTAYGEQKTFQTLEPTVSEWQRDTLTEIVEVTNPLTGRTWMDRNLGASSAATSSTDEEAYGDLYQWGRAADGHQKRNSACTSTLSNNDNPEHGNFITTNNNPYDWRKPQNDNLWQGENGTNNPCPNGYRLPTMQEWHDERYTWSSQDENGAFSSILKLPTAGLRGFYNGKLFDAGSAGYYWSSKVSLEDSGLLCFDRSGTTSFSRYRSRAYSVRCIKD